MFFRENPLLRCITTAPSRCTRSGKEAPPNQPFRIPFQCAPRVGRSGTRNGLGPVLWGSAPHPEVFEGMTPASDWLLTLGL